MARNAIGYDADGDLCLNDNKLMVGPLPWLAGTRTKMQSLNTRTAATKALSLSSIHYVPVKVGKRSAHDTIMCHITVAATATALMRLALYDSDSQGKPGVPIEESGDIASDVTGQVSYAFTSRDLHPGIYWVAIMCNATGAPTVRAIEEAEVVDGLGMNGGVVDSSITHVAQFAITFGAFPNPASSGPTISGNVLNAPNLAVVPTVA